MKATALVLTALLSSLALAPAFAATHVPGVDCGGRLLGLVTVSSAHCIPETGENLVVNAGFETCDGCAPDEGDLPTGWSYAHAHGAQGASWSTATARTGAASLQVGCTENRFSELMSTHVPAAPGEKYAAEGWTKSVTPGGVPTAHVGVFFFDEDHQMIEGLAANGSPGAEWERAYVAATAPKGTHYVSAWVGCMTQGSAFTLHLDDIVVKRLD